MCRAWVVLFYALGAMVGAVLMYGLVQSAYLGGYNNGRLDAKIEQLRGSAK